MRNRVGRGTRRAQQAGAVAAALPAARHSLPPWCTAGCAAGKTLNFSKSAAPRVRHGSCYECGSSIKSPHHGPCYRRAAHLPHTRAALFPLRGTLDRARPARRRDRGRTRLRRRRGDGDPVERALLQRAGGARLGRLQARACHLRLHHDRRDCGRHGAVFLRHHAADPPAALHDRALRRDVDGERPALPAALRRQHGRQHPPAHRQRRVPVRPAHARARHRAVAERRRAGLVRHHPVGIVGRNAAAAVRRESAVPRLSGVHRARLCGHRHAGRAPDRLAADPAAIQPAALPNPIFASPWRASPTMPNRSR